MLRSILMLAVLAAVLISAGSPAVANGDTGDNSSMPHLSAPEYYYSIPVELSFAEAADKARAELKAIGFGILWETDFQAKMKEKLDKDIPPYLILGACHPGLAFQVYEREEWVGILMPCNVVVREMPDGSVEVAIKNSLMLPQATGNRELKPIVEQVDALGQQFIEAMSKAQPTAPAPAS